MPKTQEKTSELKVNLIPIDIDKMPKKARHSKYDELVQLADDLAPGDAHEVQFENNATALSAVRVTMANLLKRRGSDAKVRFTGGKLFLFKNK